MPKKINVNSLVIVPGPIFDQRNNRKARRLTFTGRVTELYQAVSGPAARVTFVGLGNNLCNDRFLLKDLKLQGSLPRAGSTYHEVLKEKLNITPDEFETRK